MKIKRLIASGIVTVLLLGAGATCLSTVPTGYTGIVTTFGKVSDRTLEPGLHFTLPWQSVVKMDNRVQKQSVTLQCFSSDIQEVNMQYTINYQIKKSNAMDIYSSIGQNYYDTVIIPCVTESVKVITAKYTAENLVANRATMADAIETDLSTALDKYNIELVSTSIENMDFTEEFTKAVEDKQVAQQNKLKAETEAAQKKVEAQAAADAKVIEAQGNADSLRIQAEAEAEANETISKSLTAEILSKMYYDKWDGKLPTVVGADSTVLYQTPESVNTVTE